MEPKNFAFLLARLPPYTGHARKSTPADSWDMARTYTDVFRRLAGYVDRILTLGISPFDRLNYTPLPPTCHRTFPTWSPSSAYWSSPRGVRCSDVLAGHVGARRRRAQVSPTKLTLQRGGSPAPQVPTLPITRICTDCRQVLYPAIIGQTPDTPMVQTRRPCRKMRFVDVSRPIEKKGRSHVRYVEARGLDQARRHGDP
jgi:hypothetical protein